MNCILDTHTLLWFVGGDKRLPDKNRRIIESPANRLVVSAASLFEIAIKVKVGKMDLSESLNAVFQDVEASFIEVLPITSKHLLEYQHIPFYADHRERSDAPAVRPPDHRYCNS